MLFSLKYSISILIFRVVQPRLRFCTGTLCLMTFLYSYKLWYNYLRERRKQAKGKCITDPGYEEVNNCHERALVFMHKVIQQTTYSTNLLYKITACWWKLCLKLTNVFFLSFRCLEYGLITASSLCLNAR